MIKIKVVVCPSCHRVRKRGEWCQITVPDMIDLENRAGDWELELVCCPECGQKGKEGGK